MGTPSTATLTITDDDAAPVISVADSSVSEGNTGTTTTMTFTVTKTGATQKNRHGRLFDDKRHGDGRRKLHDTGVDYISANGSFTIAASAPNGTFNITVCGDNIDEGASEAFTATITSADGNATVAPASTTADDGTATGTITDDDDTPIITITPASASVNEGNTGATAVPFTLTLSNPSSQTITVTVNTGGGTATADNDYTAITNQTVTFNPGVTSQTISASVIGDFTIEPDETFNVLFSGASNATIAGAVSGTASRTVTILTTTLPELSRSKTRLIRLTKVKVRSRIR